MDRLFCCVIWVEDAGIFFIFNYPNTNPPQSLLLQKADLSETDLKTDLFI